ncbi:MAG: nucleotide sugar dehydrogenase [Deltaproteobacteria bacterium]|nr:nucleotide sugar dehydrogenase [Deltaproteobacteria bacterium]
MAGARQPARPGEERLVDTRTFIDKVGSKEAVVGVVGLGYVGLPLVITFGRKGFRMVGFDIDAQKVAKLTRGESYIKHIAAKDTAELIATKKFSPTTDYARVKECDAILICVPTPLNRNREPDMTYIESTAHAVGPHLRAGQLVVLESTTYPGTTDELLCEILEKESGLKAGKDFFLAFSPEREDPGNPKFNTRSIPKVVGGLTPACREVSAALYAAALDKVVPVSSTRVAEMTKLLENIFRCVNIALVNELKIVCDRMDIDIWEVIEASSTKPFGFMPFYPGPGLGGHCIPIDPFYLTWKAREYEVATRFIELAGDINTDMPRYVIERTAEVLNSQRKALNGCTILVVGVAYKRDIDDLRESPALRVIELLQERGVDVVYHDPFIPKLPATRKYRLEMSSRPLKPETFAQCDAAIIVTDHTGIDYQAIVDGVPLVVDTRNATKAVVKNRHKIYKA